jgi:hypothetical protein
VICVSRSSKNPESSSMGSAPVNPAEDAADQPSAERGRQSFRDERTVRSGVGDEVARAPAASTSQRRPRPGGALRELQRRLRTVQAVSTPTTFDGQHAGLAAVLGWLLDGFRSARVAATRLMRHRGSTTDGHRCRLVATCVAAPAR